MGKLTLVIGGVRGGKSRYARDLATALSEGQGGRVAFIATARVGDEEMQERIERHRKVRPTTWRTFEEPIDVSSLLSRIGNDWPIILLDCLTLLLSNLLLDRTGQADNVPWEEDILREVRKLISTAKEVPAQVIIVSNEVGMGVVPATRLGRAFRDLAGRANQLVSQEADEVLALWAGIPLRLKGEGPVPRCLL